MTAARRSERAARRTGEEEEEEAARARARLAGSLETECRPRARARACDAEEKNTHTHAPYGNSVLRTRKNKMAESKAVFTANESRGVIKFLFLQGKSAKDIHGDMSQTLGDQCPSYSTVENGIAEFKTGHFSTNDEEPPGRPRVVVE